MICFCDYKFLFLNNECRLYNWETSYFNGFLHQANRFTNFPRFQGAQRDYVRVQSSSCCFLGASLSFVRPRASLSFDQWHVTRSPPTRKRIWVGRYNNEFCFPWISIFPSTSSRETLRFSGNKIHCSPRDQSLSVNSLTHASHNSMLVIMYHLNWTMQAEDIGSLVQISHWSDLGAQTWCHWLSLAELLTNICSRVFSPSPSPSPSSLIFYYFLQPTFYSWTRPADTSLGGPVYQ